MVITLSEVGLEKAMIDSMLQRRRAQLFSARARQEELLGDLTDVTNAICRHETEIQHLEGLMAAVRPGQ